MTIDEAIEYEEEMAEINQAIAYNTDDDNWMDIAQCEKCAEEHRQIAEWLTELKRDREILNGLSIYFQSLVVDAAINKRPLMFNMRDVTEEEMESVKQYIADLLGR